MKTKLWYLLVWFGFGTVVLVPFVASRVDMNDNKKVLLSICQMKLATANCNKYQLISF